MIYYVGILKEKFAQGEHVALEYIQNSKNQFPPNHFFYVYATLLSIEHNYLNLLEHLVLENGDLDINCVFDEDSATLLIRTVKLQNYEALNVLLKARGIDVFAKDASGSSAITYALDSLKEDIAKQLLDYNDTNK